MEVAGTADKEPIHSPETFKTSLDLKWGRVIILINNFPVQEPEGINVPRKRGEFRAHYQRTDNAFPKERVCGGVLPGAFRVTGSEADEALKGLGATAEI